MGISTGNIGNTGNIYPKGGGISLTRRELTKGGLASLGFLALPGGIFAAPPHWVPKGRITEVEIPVAELPAGKNLTIAIRPISSLGTKGKSIGTTIRV